MSPESAVILSVGIPIIVGWLCRHWMYSLYKRIRGPRSETTMTDTYSESLTSPQTTAPSQPTTVSQRVFNALAAGVGWLASNRYVVGTYRWLSTNRFTRAWLRVPFLGSLTSDLVYDIQREIREFPPRMRIPQIEFDYDRWEREGEALDPNARIYFRVPMRAWLLSKLGLVSFECDWTLLFQDFWFRVSTDQIFATQRAFGDSGVPFFNSNISAIADVTAGNIKGRLLERFGVKILRIQIAHRSIVEVPILADGLRWPTDFRTPCNGNQLAAEEAAVAIMRYLMARVTNNGPFSAEQREEWQRELMS